MSAARVQILLATYQGESWLPELLQSIQSQSHSDWTLIACETTSASIPRGADSCSAAAESDRRIIIKPKMAGNAWER